MAGVEISWIFIISLCSTYAFALPSLNHHNFDMAPINAPKSEKLPRSKIAPRSITKLSFSSSPKSPDPIDEEENFWVNPRREQKRHYESVKMGQSSKNPEGGSNLIDTMNKNQPAFINSQMNLNFEALPTWFRFPKSFSRNGPKSDKATEKTTLNNPKDFDPEFKSQEDKKKITFLKMSLPDSKVANNIKIQQSSSSEKNNNSKKSTGAVKSSSTDKKTPDSKADLDISDLLILDELSQKLDDSSEEKGKEESEKQTVAPKIATVQPQRGYFVPPKKIKMFSPIYASDLDIIRAPYQKGGFSINNLSQRHGQIHNFEINKNREKDLDLEENEVKVHPKEHLSFGDKGPILVFNNLRKVPIQLAPQLNGNLFKSEGSVEVHNFPALNNLPESSFTMTEISVSPAQRHIEDIGSFLESLKMHGQDGDPKMLKLNFRAVKPLLKKDIFPSKIESSSHSQNNLVQDSKQTQALNSILMKGNMIIDFLQESATNEVSRDTEKAKDKKEIEKLSKHDFKEFCKKNVDKYPKLYQFLEKFSDKIVEAALRYEIAMRYASLLDSSNHFDISQKNSTSNVSQF